MADGGDGVGGGGEEVSYEDLYEDLDALHGSIQTQKLGKLYEGVVKDVASLKAERDEMKQQIESLHAQKQTLEANLVSIYNTAALEVQRKNKQIADLQREVVKLQTERERGR